MSRINIQDLEAAIIPHIPSLIPAHLPNARKVSGGWRIGDLDGKKGSSTFINEEGEYFDHSTGEGGGLLHLMELFGNTSGFVETCKWAASRVGYEIPDRAERQKAVASVTILDTLDEDAISYLEGKTRGFTRDVVSQLPIKSTSQSGQIAILHNDESGKKTEAIRYYDYRQKRWSTEPNPAHTLWPLDYVTATTKDWAEYIVICEGHWDAIAYAQAGIPAVSIPSGVSNDKWIEECFDFIASFQQIVLSYDNDEPGRDACARVAARLAAAIKPPRLISHPAGCKDANDVLIAHGADKLHEELEEAKPYAPSEILPCASLIHSAIEMANDLPYQQATPFDDFPFNFRHHESTLYTGRTGHGKSNLVDQLIGYLTDKYDCKAAIASFEDQPERITARLLIRQFGRSGLVDCLATRQFLERISIYNTAGGDTKANDPQKIVDLFIHLHLRWGVTHFVIDNLMTLSVEREDYEGIVGTAELFRKLVMTYPVHLHLVAHPRKPSAGQAHQAPDPYDVRGPAEIADLAFNILSLWRNTPKERQMEEMIRAGASEDTLRQFDKEVYDAKLVCHKQRFTGDHPSIPLWFEKDRGIFTNTR